MFLEHDALRGPALCQHAQSTGICSILASLYTIIRKDMVMAMMMMTMTMTMMMMMMMIIISTCSMKLPLQRKTCAFCTLKPLKPPGAYSPAFWKIGVLVV